MHYYNSTKDTVNFENIQLSDTRPQSDTRGMRSLLIKTLWVLYAA